MLVLPIQGMRHNMAHPASRRPRQLATENSDTNTACELDPSPRATTCSRSRSKLLSRKFPCRHVPSLAPSYGQGDSCARQSDEAGYQV